MSVDEYEQELTPFNYVAHDTMAMQAQKQGTSTWRWLCLSDEAKHEAREAVFAQLAQEGYGRDDAIVAVTSFVKHTPGFAAWREREIQAAEARERLC